MSRSTGFRHFRPKMDVKSTKTRRKQAFPVASPHELGYKLTMPPSIQITLNGQLHRTAAGSVAELVAELNLDRRVIAVERNLAVVSRSAYAETALADGDRIEVVHMIGGG